MVDGLGQDGLSAEELGAEGATALPDKEVVSILDLNADINLAIDAAAPIDLAAAANANVAAPIDGAVGANVLSIDSTAQALSDQGVLHQPGPRRERGRPRRPGQRDRPGRRRLDGRSGRGRRPGGRLPVSRPRLP